MGLKNMSLLTGATISATGGTAFVFADDGVTVQNGVHLVVPATSDYRVRESATFKFKPPALLGDGTYTRDKKEITYVVPIILASGKISFQTMRVIRELHPEFSAANATNMNKLVAQMLAGDSDTDNFWSAGSLS